MSSHRLTPKQKELQDIVTLALITADKHRKNKDKNNKIIDYAARVLRRAAQSDERLDDD